MNQKDLALRLALVHAAGEGNLERLQCPVCRLPNVTVHFTNPADGEYRTWFTCGGCDFSMRVHELDRPKWFSERKVDADLQRNDCELLDQAIFKKP